MDVDKNYTHLSMHIPAYPTKSVRRNKTTFSTIQMDSNLSLR